MSSSHVVWYTARASGYTALSLLTLSLVLGLVLSLRLRSQRWPRFLTSELHRFVTLTTLVFVALHTASVLADPFVGFSAADVLVPFHSSYRPLGMALGIVASYLALALWLSSRLQRRIGWRAWRALHHLAFAVYAGAVSHTLLTGEDAGAGWGAAVAAGSVLLVGGLAVARLAGLPAGVRRPVAALASSCALGALVTLVVAARIA